MKVRVPKELRPPSRYGAFEDPGKPHFTSIFYGRFRVKGVFREPRPNEFYWSPFEKGMVVLLRVSPNMYTGPRVILERVP